jgi:hypothetical protein
MDNCRRCAACACTRACSVHLRRVWRPARRWPALSRCRLMITHCRNVRCVIRVRHISPMNIVRLQFRESFAVAAATSSSSTIATAVHSSIQKEKPQSTPLSKLQTHQQLAHAIGVGGCIMHAQIVTANSPNGAGDCWHDVVGIDLLAIAGSSRVRKQNRHTTRSYCA